MKRPNESPEDEALPILSIPFFILFASPFMVVIYLDIKEKFTGNPKPKENEKQE